jgi:succinate-acetate transporter protein
MSGHGDGWANPAPAGLVALAVACFIFYALLSGTCKAPGCLPLMGCWLIGGFVVQVIVGVIELKEGALTGGNVFLFFSAFFMLTGGLEMFVKYFAILNKWPLDATIDGWAWMALFIALLLYMWAYYKQSTTVMGLLLIILTIGVGFVTFIDLGWMSGAYKPYAAYCLLMSGILGLYQSGAIILNTAFGKTIMPCGGPLMK